MNPLTVEWVAKAEANFAGATALNRRRKQPLHDLVCFHAQQSRDIFKKRALRFPRRTS
jgi:hypothetical protein